MKKLFVMLMLSTFLIGCASTKSTVSKDYQPSKSSPLSLTIKKNPNVNIPSVQYDLLESQIRDGLTSNGLLASKEDDSSHSVEIYIHNFKMRDDVDRLVVGIIAGCDNISSTVIVTDKHTKKEIGNSSISIEECAAWGVASQVIKKYTNGVIAFLSDDEAL